MSKNEVNAQSRVTTQLKLNRISWTILGLLCLCVVLSVLFLDNRLARWMVVQKPSWPFRAWAMGFRQLGKAWASVWLLCLWFWVTKRSRPVLCAILALALTALLVLPLKGIVGRARPKEVFAAALQSVPESLPLHGHSFPSGDTATVFAVAGALIGFVRWPWLCLLFAGALGIGALRVIVLAHYLSDVCAGMAIGLLCGYLARRVDTRLNINLDGLDQRHWMALVILAIIPPVIGLCEGPEPVLYFYQSVGIVAVCVALVYKIGVWKKYHQ